MDREQYERDLQRRQQDHLRQVQKNYDYRWKPCAHDQCTMCVGTGIKADGSACNHCLYCDCPKCAPYVSSHTAVVGPGQTGEVLSVTAPPRAFSFTPVGRDATVFVGGGGGTGPATTATGGST